MKKEDNHHTKSENIKTYFSVGDDIWSVESELLLYSSSIKTISSMGSREQFSNNTSKHTRWEDMVDVSDENE